MHEYPLPAGYELKRFNEIDSTNAEALRLSSGPEAGPVWVWADRQARGRGREGRMWVSEKGNLFATLLLRLTTDTRAPELSFVAALALYDVCKKFVPQAALSLKWPNDILLDGKKVGGILLERKNEALVIGCGLNVANCPSDTQFPATCLVEHGAKVELSDVFGCLALAMDIWLKRWRGEGFEVIRETWISKAYGLGQEITVRHRSFEKTGLFETLDEHGALVLAEADGEKSRILAGDVFFAP